MPRAGLVSTSNPGSIPLSWPDLRQMAVPDIPVHLAELHPGLNTINADEAQRHGLRNFPEHSEVRADTVKGRAEG
jgi:hypothetical protein